jgi:CheY-like chemotaxis protein
MKTYRELYNAAREDLIEVVDKAKSTHRGDLDDLEDRLSQHVDVATDAAVPNDMDGMEILNILRQQPNALKANIHLTSDHGTVQDILVDLLRNALHADFLPEAKTIIDAAVEDRRAQQSSPTP